MKVGVVGAWCDEEGDGLVFVCAEKGADAVVPGVRRGGAV